MQPLKLLSFVLVFSSVQYVSAQEIDVTWREFKNQDKYVRYLSPVVLSGKSIELGTKQDLKRIGAGAGDLFMEKAIFTVYDKSDAVVKTQELLVEEKFAKAGDLVEFGNNIYFLYTAFLKPADRTAVYSLRINPTTLAAEEKKELASYPGKFDYRITMDIKVSDARNYLLFTLYNEEPGVSRKVVVAAVDKNLQTIWSSDLEGYMEKGKFGLQSTAVDDNGRAYVILSQPNFVSTKLVIVDKTTTRGRETLIDAKGFMIGASQFMFNGTETVDFVGMYKEIGNLTGVFTSKLDAGTGKITSVSLYPFTSELLDQVEEDGFGSAKKGGAGLSPLFRFGGVKKRSNGSFDVLSEFVKPRRDGDRMEFNYGDIVNANITTDKKVSFTCISKKQQNYNEELYLSYFPKVFNDKLIIFYSDDKQNLKNPENGKPNNVHKFNNSYFLAGIISNDGKLQRKVIFDNGENEYIPDPAKARDVTDTKIDIRAFRYRTGNEKRRNAIIEIK